MKRYGLLLLLLAAVASAEVLHPPGGGSPISGIPIPAQQGGTGVNGQSTWVDGDCVEAFLDVDGKKKLRTSGDPCGTGSGGSPVPTQTPWSCGAGNGARGMGGTPECFVVPTPDGAGAAVPTQTAHDCGSGNYQRGHNSTPICIVAPTPHPLATANDCGSGNAMRGNGGGTPICVVMPTPDGNAGGFDPTTLNDTTFGDGSDSAIRWIWNVPTGTDPSLVFADSYQIGVDAIMSVTGSGAIIATDTQCTNCLTGTEIDESSLTGVSASNVVCSGCINLSSEVTDTLPVASGGTGATTLSGLVRGTFTSPLSAAELSGDATTSGSNVVTVVDDSHAHTTTTISGLDISSDTNLAVTSPIVLTGDTVSIQNAAADGSTKGAAAFTSTDFDSSSGVISLDANVVKVGGAAILSSQIPTVFAADGVSRCLGDDNDWCAAYNATHNMVFASGVTINFGPTPTASPTATVTTTPTSTAATPTATAATPTVQPTTTHVGATPTPVASPALLIRGRDPRCQTICTQYQGALSANGDFLVGVGGRASIVPSRSEVATPLQVPGYFANMQCVFKDELGRGERATTLIETMTCSTSTDGAQLSCSAATALTADCAGTDNVAENVCRGYPLRSAQLSASHRWHWRMTDVNSAGGLYRTCCVDFCPEP